MFVHRSTMNPEGGLNEAAALMKELHEQVPPPHGMRILTSWLHPSWAIAVEFEFDSLGEYEEHWKQFWGSPKVAAWMSENRERWDEVLGGEPGVQELWHVSE